MFIQFMAGKQKYALSGGTKCFEISVPVQRQNPETGKPEWIWVGKKFFNTIEAATSYILQLKLQQCDAESFTELLKEVQDAKAELSGLFGVDFKQKVVEKNPIKQVPAKGNSEDEVLRKKPKGRARRNDVPENIAKPEKNRGVKKIEKNTMKKKTLLKRKK